MYNNDKIIYLAKLCESCTGRDKEGSAGTGGRLTNGAYKTKLKHA